MDVMFIALHKRKVNKNKGVFYMCRASSCCYPWMNENMLHDAYDRLRLYIGLEALAIEYQHRSPWWSSM